MFSTRCAGFPAANYTGNESRLRRDGATTAAEATLRSPLFEPCRVRSVTDAAPGTEAAELWRPPEGPCAFSRWSRAFALGGGGGRGSSWSTRTDRVKFQTADVKLVVCGRRDHRARGLESVRVALPAGKPRGGGSSQSARALGSIAGGRQCDSRGPRGARTFHREWNYTISPTRSTQIGAVVPQAC